MSLLQEYLSLAPYFNRSVQPGQTHFPKPYSGPRGAGGMPSANPRLQSGQQGGGAGGGLGGGMGGLLGMIGGGAPDLSYTGALNSSSGLGGLLSNPGASMGGMYDMSQGATFSSPFGGASTGFAGLF